MKKFRKKKDMWVQIGEDIKNILSVKKSLLQCENRSKTILKSEKKAGTNDDVVSVTNE